MLYHIAFNRTPKTVCNYVPVVRRDRLWQSYLVFGILSAAHILLVLFTHWSVDVKCAVAFRACSDMQQATHCKVICAPFVADTL